MAVAPGRINIIGEHTDYAGGLCLPAAVDRYLAVAVSPATEIGLASEQFPGAPVTADPEQLTPRGDWADLPLGVLAELRAEGVPVAVRLSVVSDIPPGSGLSSSAALGVATALAVLRLADQPRESFEVARLCRRAENSFLGVPSGLMDQVACAAGRKDNALLFDAGLELAELVALPPDFAWLVVESGIERTLRGSAYADRPREAAEALELARARHRELRRLCDLDPGQVEALELPQPLDRRARHVVGECLRVRMAVACVEAGNIEALGELLTTSHRSLARDAEVSLPELDQIVEVASDAGCTGARVMGAGFGGSVLALVATDRAAEAAGAIRAHLGAGAGEVHRVAIVDGAMATLWR